MRPWYDFRPLICGLEPFTKRYRNLGQWLAGLEADQFDAVRYVESLQEKYGPIGSIFSRSEGRYEEGHENTVHIPCIIADVDYSDATFLRNF